jgi:hypothetical protein
MTLADHVRAYDALIESSFDNAVGAVQSVHFTFVDMSVGLLREVGLPASLADGFTERHRRAMNGIYDGVRATNHQLGGLVVAQVELISDFARSLNAEVLGDADAPASRRRSERGIRVVEGGEPS